MMLNVRTKNYFYKCLFERSILQKNSFLKLDQHFNREERPKKTSTYNNRHMKYHFIYFFWPFLFWNGFIQMQILNFLFYTYLIRNQSRSVFDLNNQAYLSRSCSGIYHWYNYLHVFIINSIHYCFQVFIFFLLKN